MLTGKSTILNGTTYLIMERTMPLIFTAWLGLLEYLERTFLGRVLLSTLHFTLSLIQLPKTNEKTLMSSTKIRTLEEEK